MAGLPFFYRNKSVFSLTGKNRLRLELGISLLLMMAAGIYLYFIINLGGIIRRQETKLGLVIAQTLKSEFSYELIKYRLLNILSIKNISINNSGLKAEIPETDIKFDFYSFLKTFSLQDSINNVTVTGSKIILKPSRGDISRPADLQELIKILKKIRIVLRSTALTSGAFEFKIDRMEIFSENRSIYCRFLFEGSGEYRVQALLSADEQLRYISAEILFYEGYHNIASFKGSGKFNNGRLSAIIEGEDTDLKCRIIYSPEEGLTADALAKDIPSEKLLQYANCLGYDPGISSFFALHKVIPILPGAGKITASINFISGKRDGISAKIKSRRPGENSVFYYTGSGSKKKAYYAMEKNGSFSAAAAWDCLNCYPEVSFMFKNFAVGTRLLNGGGSLLSVSNDYSLLDCTSLAVNRSRLPLRIGIQHNSDLFKLQIFNTEGVSGEIEFDRNRDILLNISLTDAKINTLTGLLGINLLPSHTINGNIMLRKTGTNTDLSGRISVFDDILAKDFFSCRLTGSNNIFRISEGQIQTGAAAQNFSLLLDLNRNYNNFQITLAAKNASLKNILSGTVSMENETVKIDLLEAGAETRYTAEIDLKKNTSGCLEIKNLKLSATANLSMTADFSFSTFFQAGGNINLTQLNPWSKQSGLSAAFAWNDQSITFSKITYFDEQHSLIGRGEALHESWPLSFSYNFEMKNEDTDESFIISGENSGYSTTSTMLVKKFYLDNKKTLGPLSVLSGRLRSEAVITGDLRNPNLNAKIYIRNLELNSRNYLLYFELYRHHGEFELKNLLMKNENAGSAETDCLKVKNAVYKNGVLSLPAVLHDFRSFAVFSGGLNFTWRQNENRLSVVSDRLLMNGEKILPLSARIVFEKQRILFSRQGSHGPGGEIIRRGADHLIDFKYYYDDRPIFFTEGIAGGKKTDLIIHSQKFNLQHLNLFTEIIEEHYPEEAFFTYKHNNNYYRANLFLHVYNEGDKILLDGRMLCRGRTRLTGFARPSSSGLLDITIKKNRFQLDDLRLDYRKSFLQADGFFSLSLPAGVIDQYAMTIFTENETGIPVKYQSPLFDAEGNLSGSVALSGSQAYPAAAGQMELKNCDLSFKGNSSADSQNPNFFERLDWDMEIKAGERTRFYNEMLETLIKKGSAVKFSGRVYDDSFRVTGQLEGARGIYSWAGVNFRLDKIRADFREDMDEIDPFMDVQGSYRTKDDRGETIIIYLTMNSFLSRRNINLTSDPPKSADDIRQFLGLAPLTASGSGKSAISAVKAISIDANILRPLERKIRRLSGLDIFRIDTDFFEHLNTGSFSTAAQNAFLDTKISLGMGKYVTDRLFLYYDISYQRGQTNSVSPFAHALDIEYEFGEFDLQYEWKIDRTFSSWGDHDIKILKKWRF